MDINKNVTMWSTPDTRLRVFYFLGVNDLCAVSLVCSVFAREAGACIKHLVMRNSDMLPLRFAQSVTGVSFVSPMSIMTKLVNVGMQLPFLSSIVLSDETNIVFGDIAATLVCLFSLEIGSRSMITPGGTSPVVVWSAYRSLRRLKIGKTSRITGLSDVLSVCDASLCDLYLDNSVVILNGSPYSARLTCLSTMQMIITT